MKNNRILLSVCLVMLVIVSPVLAYVYWDEDGGSSQLANGETASAYSYVSWDDEAKETYGVTSTDVSDGTYADVNGIQNESCFQDDHMNTYDCYDSDLSAEYQHIGPDLDGSEAWGSSSHEVESGGMTYTASTDVDARP